MIPLFRYDVRRKASLTLLFSMPSKPVHDPLAPPLPGATTKTRNTTCYMCACRCGIRVHVRNGEVRYIEGNPDHPVNKGVICAKGSSGIMKQYSPARLTKPLMRKPGAARGAGEFVAISWDEAFRMLAERLGRIRATDPKKFAMFTGRDQMQALSGLFARQFGTPNYAAHGGFCSVNMAAGMIYTIGGSFWEFGGPDLERAKLFVMIGTAEDHHSNPLKIAISKFKRDGGRFISINPIRTGYSAIADEWVPIRPGTDGALLLALIHELIALGLYDREFLARFTNAGQLVNLDADTDDYGLIVRDEQLPPDPDRAPEHDRTPVWWDRISDRPVRSHTDGADPYLYGEFTLPDGRNVKPAHQLLKERVAEYTPEWAAAITGIPATTIRRLAQELGITARDGKIELPIAWTDSWGREHETVTGNPVAFHAMRGLAAHSNGFQTIRALAILMSLLGTIDRPGGFRHKPPFPRMVPPSAKPPNSLNAVQPDTPLAGLALGWPGEPADLFVDDDGTPVRIDKAFSWEYPLAVHGLMHNVITNAWRGDPYPIDTLLIFMANMAWNSTMNTSEIRRMLNDKREDGEHKIPFLVVCDTFQSETTAFADLVLPDTTYLERHDVMSMLDRPISEFDGPIDSVRVPVVPPKGECKPFQEVLIELASRLKFPGVRARRRHAQVPRLSGLHRQLRDRPGLGHRVPVRLAGQGRRQVHARRAESAPMGDVREEQLRLPPQAAAFVPVHAQLEPRLHGMGAARANPSLHRSGRRPDLFGSAAEVSTRRAGQGHRHGNLRRISRRASRPYFDPLPFFYEPLEAQQTDLAAIPAARGHAAADGDVPRVGFAERVAPTDPRAQPPVRQSGVARAAGIEDGGWMWVESPWGKVRCLASYSEAVEPGTVWTWNAIGKAPGAWHLAPDANESRRGFLLNHLITDELPAGRRRTHFQLGSDHRTGGVVRRPRAHPQGRARRAEDDIAAILAGARGAGNRDRRAPRWQAFFAERKMAMRVTSGALAVTQLALVIDLNVCVGCHACVTSCKEWNTSGSAGPLADFNPYDKDPTGTFFNRVQTFEVGEYPDTQTVHFPKSCLHCEDPPCVPVCPTGASYKRAEDGIVLVDYDKCIGCKYCAWACPYGVRELDEERQVMTKCTLCVDRITDATLPQAERKPACVLACPTNARLFGDIHDPESIVSVAIRENAGYALMPEWGTHPANHYLPRRKTERRSTPTNLRAPTIRSRSTDSCRSPHLRNPRSTT